MTSIHTNAASMAALAASRSVSLQLMRVQDETSTGLRISNASHNAAYWSIATTMRSDSHVLSTVSDALQLAAGIADVAYTSLDQTTSILSEIRAKLVLAASDGLDLTKIQGEIEQLAQQTVSIASASSYGGTNWLQTSIPDIYETSLEARSDTVVSSFARQADGGVRLETFGVDLRKTSLFNEQGGGILQGDPRSPLTIGGIRLRTTEDGVTTYDRTHPNFASTPRFEFSFSGPLTFGAADYVSFAVVVDQENPSHGLPGPLHPGISATITIDKALVDTQFGRGDGTIQDYREARAVLSAALQQAGIGGQTSLSFGSMWNGTGYVPKPDAIILGSSQNSGSPGGHISVQSAGGTLAFGTLGGQEVWAGRRSYLDLTFEPFKLYKDVEVTFNLSTNNGTPVDLKIDRALVDTVLGKDDGRVDTIDEMATLMEALLTGRPDIDVEIAGNMVKVSTSTDYDRNVGSKSSMYFRDIEVNIEPIPELGILDIDIASHPNMLNAYLQSVDAMLTRCIDGAAAMGALKMRIDIQTSFVSRLEDALKRGIGQLVDADLAETSARLQALQAQKQLALNSLSVASSKPQVLLQLFG